MLFWYIGLLLGFGWLLSLSADIVLRGASFLAVHLRIKGFVLGFLLLGLVTSTPELFVSLQSVADGVPQLAVGSLIGGSILLLSFIMGLSAVILGRVRLDHAMTFNELVLGSAVVAAPAIVLWDGSLTRTDGLLLIGVYLLHLVVVNRQEHLVSALEHPPKRLGHWSWALGKVIVGVVGMAIASRVIVKAAQAIVGTLNVPAFVFGLFVLAVGVNLPELALAWRSIVRRQQAIAFGDFLGSGAANTLILGMVCLLSPFVLAQREKLMFSLVLLTAVSAFFVWSVHSRRDITRREGFGLLFFYLLFVAYEIVGLG